jgi:hypothetical protein
MDASEHKEYIFGKLLKRVNGLFDPEHEQAGLDI